MRAYKLPIVGVLLMPVFFSCHKEYSYEMNKQTATDTLPSNYPFANGFCDVGVSSLGVSIFDTVNFVPSDSSQLPESILLDMPVPGNQSRQNSCTSWATVYGAANYYIHITTGKPYSDTGNLNPQFIYNQISKGMCGCTSFTDNLYLLKTKGACSLQAMPYNPDECDKQPDILQKFLAKKYKIKGWAKVDLHNADLIKRAVAEKKPVLFAINVDNGFQKIKQPYLWKKRTDPGEGHSMIICGFDDHKSAFRVMNSWGPAWGDSGFVWIDYDFFLQNVHEGGYVVL